MITHDHRIYSRDGILHYKKIPMTIPIGNVHIACVQCPKLYILETSATVRRSLTPKLLFKDTLLDMILKYSSCFLIEIEVFYIKSYH